MRIIYLGGLLLLGATLLQVQGQQTQGDWPMHGRDAGETRYSPLKQINTSNVGRLQVAWTYDTKVAPPNDAAAGRPETPPGAGGRGRIAAGGRGANAGSAGAPAGGEEMPDPSAPPAGRGFNRMSSSTPLVVGGVMYLTTGYGRAVALDPETGKEVWVRDVGYTPATKGISYWPGDAGHAPRIILGTDGREAWLIALDAKTGEYAAGFGTDGKISLRQGTNEKFATRPVGISSPPLIYKNLVITGAHSQESPSLGPSADIRAWDAITGTLIWTFHTVPRPGEANHEVWKDDQWLDRAGANVWGLMTLDEARGIAYFPVGTPATDFYGADRLGQNLYGSTLLALDAATGKVKWYFQTTHHDNWDYDLTSPPQLDRREAERADDSRGCAIHEAGPALYLQSSDGRAGVRCGGATGRFRQSAARRRVLADPAVSDQAEADRAHDILARRSRQGHA